MALQDLFRKKQTAALMRVPVGPQPKAAEGSIPPGGFWNPWYMVNDHSFVPLTNTVAFGVYPARLIAAAERLFVMNPVYKRILELLTSHIYGNGPMWTVKAKQPALKILEASAKDVLDKFFGPEGNDFPGRMPQWINEQCLTGEAILPAFVNPQNGRVKLSWIPARMIGRIDVNAYDYSETTAIYVVANPTDGPVPGVLSAQTQGRKFDVIHTDYRPYVQSVDGNAPGVENGIIGQETNPNQGKQVGECFFFKTGALEGQVRGMGDGFSIHGPVQDLEQAIKDWAKRYDVQSAVVYDLVMKGWSQEQIDALGTITLPTGREPFVHNELAELKMLAPSMKVEELALMIRTKMVYILGAVGIPEMVMADGAMTNVATAEQQMPTLESKFNLRRKQWNAAASKMGMFALQQANDKGMLWENTGTNEAPIRGNTRVLSQAELQDLLVQFELEPLQRNDSKAGAATLTAVTTSLQAAEANNYIDNDSAGRVFRALVGQFGVALDEDVVKTKIAAQKKLKQATPSGNPADKSDIGKQPSTTGS